MADDKTNRENLKKLIQKFDEKCEAANAHDFVISHRALAILMCEKIGVWETLKIFRALEREAGKYGLPGLTGVCSLGPKENFLKKRGISDNWAAWDIPKNVKP